MKPQPTFQAPFANLESTRAPTVQVYWKVVAALVAITWPVNTMEPAMVAVGCCCFNTLPCNFSWLTGPLYFARDKVNESPFHCGWTETILPWLCTEVTEFSVAVTAATSQLTILPYCEWGVLT
jgi:hypothetical protein